MRALTASEIIRLWETVHRLHPIDQALSVLQIPMPEHSRDELAAMPLGQRDAQLLALRGATFGDVLTASVHCPQCGETVEFELRCSALADKATEPQQKHFHRDDYRVTVRPLDSFDLAAAAGETTLRQAREVLLQRCVAEVRYRGKLIAPQSLPDEIENSITETALAADPQAEILLDLNCPACEHHWNSMLDIGQLLWMEITARAQRLLMEVHLLARAYGWAETEILGLTPARRAAYLHMVSA